MPQLEPFPQPIERFGPSPEFGNPWDELPNIITASDPDQPDTPRSELVAMRKWWELGDILLRGLDAIKAHHAELLPPLGTDEQSDERDARLRKTIATPFYADTIDRLVARPFGRPIQYLGTTDGMLPDAVAYLDQNADGTGKSLTALARDHLYQAIHRSGDCLLVDLPGQDEPTSQREVLDRRPIIKRIGLDRILGWGFRVDDEGRIVTTVLRLLDELVMPVGMFGESHETVVRMIRAAQDGEPGFSVIYRRNERGDWFLDQDLARAFNGERIMLHATWTNQIGPTIGRSPLSHLAELNMAYIVGDSEQAYGASHARVSTLWTTALEQEEKSGQLGGNVMAVTPIKKIARRLVRGHMRHIRLPPESQIGLLETAGSGLIAGRAELTNLEDRMERLGAAHTSRSGVTATATRSDDSRDTSNLRSWVGRVETTLQAVLRDCDELMAGQAVLPAEFRVQVFRDWEAAEEREQAMPHVLGSWDRQLIPARVVHDQLRRFGVLASTDTTDDLLAERSAEQQQQEQQDGQLAILDAIERLRSGAETEPVDEPNPKSETDREPGDESEQAE